MEQNTTTPAAERTEQTSKNASACVPEEAHGWRLDKTLGLLLSESAWGLRARRRLCDRGLVLVAGKPGTPGTKVRAGQEILFLADPEAPAAESVREALSDAVVASDTLPSGVPSGNSASPYLIHHDAELFTVFKPAGLHTVALTGSQAPSLEGSLPTLLARLGTPDMTFNPCLLNRLDTPTSGLVLGALAQEGALRWRRAERLGHTDKYYLAIIEGQPLYAFSVCRRLDTDNRTRTRVRHTDDPDSLRHTDVTLLHAFTAEDAPALPRPCRSDSTEDSEKLHQFMLAGCRIRKGARHQIRAHLAAAGHPLLGDTLYGGSPLIFPQSFPMPQISFFLHHARVVLPGFEAFCDAPWLDLLPAEAQERARLWTAGTE